MKEKILTVLTLLALGLLALSCKNEPPPAVQVPALELVAEDASCTEAWLKITLTQTTTDSVLLTRDNQTVRTLRLSTPDSLLIDEGLLPKRSYVYKAYRLSGTSVTDSSEAVTLTTMDTTSSAWQWALDTLGTHSSVLYDVAIIHDSLAYAVGEIYKRDSLGNLDPTPYGLAVWNGTNWTLRKLFAQYPGVPSPSLVRPHGIFAFSDRDIWFADADVFSWDGQSQFLRVHQVVNTVLLPGQYVDKLWGSSPSNIHAVGINGAIAHYDGTRWRRIESGTSVRLLDVWGTADGREVWTCGWDVSTGENVVLRKQSSLWQVLQLPPYVSENELLGTLWMQNNTEVLITGSGDVFRQSILNINHIRRYPVDLGAYAYRIRGSARNDVALCGDFSMVWHWNGTTWRKYDQLTNNNDRLYGLAVTQTIIAAVGTRYGGIGRTGLVIRGKR